MKIWICIFCLSSLWLNSQNDSLLRQFESAKNTLNHRGMVVLTSWAAGNIAGSALGYGLTRSYEEKQFYLMSGAWGLINLSIGLPGILAHAAASKTYLELQQSQTKVEKIFLANALLDVIYISGGAYLKEYAGNQPELKKQQQFNGFGNAIIMQGAGLLIFDTMMTLLNNRNRKKNLDPILKHTTVSFSGNFIKISYQLH